MKRVVIIGGGYAGMMLARALDASMEVVLVEPRAAFVHCVAAIRATVEPSLVDQIILPYDKLLRSGRVVRDRAVGIEAGTVRLASGSSVGGDFIVVATGSLYAAPFKPRTDDIGAFREASRIAHEQLKAADRIVIVGAGAVGVELAGEIASKWRKKSVLLLSDLASLFPPQPAALGQRVERDLKSLGVRMRMGVRAKGLFGAAGPVAGPVELEDGERIDADLVFPVMGARPVNELLATVSGVSFDRAGRAVVDPWLRPSPTPTLFALGDSAAGGEAMTVVGATRQAGWLAKTIGDMARGKRIEKLKAYAPWPVAPLLVPVGRSRGASVLPMGKAGTVVGGWMTGAIKGQRLFIPRYRKEFNVDEK